MFVDIGVAHRLVHRVATVSRVMPYGAFAKVADGVEGLIHVSELSAARRVLPTRLAGAT